MVMRGRNIRGQQKAMFSKMGSGHNNNELNSKTVEDIAIFQTRGRVTGGGINFKKNKKVTGKILIVTSRTQGGVVLKVLPKRLVRSQIIKPKTIRRRRRTNFFDFL